MGHFGSHFVLACIGPASIFDSSLILTSLLEGHQPLRPFRYVTEKIELVLLFLFSVNYIQKYYCIMCTYITHIVWYCIEYPLWRTSETSMIKQILSHLSVSKCSSSSWSLYIRCAQIFIQILTGHLFGNANIYNCIYIYIL